METLMRKRPYLQVFLSRMQKKFPQQVIRLFFSNENVAPTTCATATMPCV
jgi:hypothetical protein